MSETDGREVIAIDGPSGAGKSSVARGLAKRLAVVYVNTGFMYRALALAARRAGASEDSCADLAVLAAGLGLEFSPDGERLSLDGEDITPLLRDPEISRLSSKISACPQVREEMVKRQRQIGRGGRVVMEGRDIGTYVFPEAPYKIYLDATLQERARRRQRELAEKGLERSVPELVADMEKRDYADAHRELAPLQRAPDAFYVDSTGKDIEEVIDEIVSFIEGKTKK